MSCSPRSLCALGALVAGAVAIAGCTTAVSASATFRSASVRTVSHAPTTIWLCRPGSKGDPCARPLRTTTVPATGARTTQTAKQARGSGFDCFYVYPTVSQQSTVNASLKVQPAEVHVAVAQASPFSQVCRVWAPMYRQVTLSGLYLGGEKADVVAYDSLLSGWNDYLKHDNHGRPIVFIGHSQGAAMLIRLLEARVDKIPKLRDKVVSAILLGGNVTVPTGQLVGSTFQHLPLCSATTEFGCVIAYSSFPSQPPSNSVFGIPGQGVSLQSGQTASVGLQVACVNPAAIGGPAASLDPWFPTSTLPPPAPAVTTPWVRYPDLYTSSCRTSGDTTWLQVTDVAGAGDTRPVVTESLGATWGFHLADVNLASGNLVADVHSEEHAYALVHH